MSSKLFIAVGAMVGSVIGGYIPYLWGDVSFLSLSSIIFNGIGGIAGIFAGLWVYQNYLE